MKLRQIGPPFALMLVGFVLVVVALQLMTSEFLMLWAIAILGVGATMMLAYGLRLEDALNRATVRPGPSTQSGSMVFDAEIG